MVRKSPSPRSRAAEPSNVISRRRWVSSTSLPRLARYHPQTQPRCAPLELLGCPCASSRTSVSNREVARCSLRTYPQGRVSLRACPLPTTTSRHEYVLPVSRPSKPSLGRHGRYLPQTVMSRSGYTTITIGNTERLSVRCAAKSLQKHKTIFRRLLLRLQPVGLCGCTIRTAYSTLVGLPECAHEQVNCASRRDHNWCSALLGDGALDVASLGLSLGGCLMSWTAQEPRDAALELPRLACRYTLTSWP
jgi:hypothetical protein